MNRDTFLEFIGLVFDTGIVLENELEIGRRTCLDKVDKDFFQVNVSGATRGDRTHARPDRCHGDVLLL